MEAVGAVCCVRIGRVWTVARPSNSVAGRGRPSDFKGPSENLSGWARAAKRFRVRGGERPSDSVHTQWLGACGQAIPSAEWRAAKKSYRYSLRACMHVSCAIYRSRWSNPDLHTPSTESMFMIDGCA
jgi:hypothetical protein